MINFTIKANPISTISNAIAAEISINNYHLKNHKSKFSLIFIIFCIALFLLPSSSKAKNSTDHTTNSAPALNLQFDKFKETVDSNTTNDGGTSSNQKNISVQDSNDKLSVDINSYNSWTFMDTEKTLEWQHIETKVIFCLVVLIVTLGLLLCILQFYMDYLSKYGLTAAKAQPHDKTHAIDSKAEPAPTTSDPHPEVEKHIEQKQSTTINASKDGIQISSPVLGVVMLALSLAFFYLYLRNVYPVNEVPGTSGNQEHRDSKSSKNFYYENQSTNQ